MSSKFGSSNSGSSNSGSSNSEPPNSESPKSEFPKSESPKSGAPRAGPGDKAAADAAMSGDAMSGDAPHHISRRLPSSLSAYHEFVQDILEKLQALGWGEDVLFGIHMALEESISNAIRHGNNEESDKMVQVDCQLSSTRFWVKVCDEGDGYEPDAVPDCRCPENLEVPGGRGLALIRHYMTSVKHTDCGACVVMEKRIQAE